jgi:alkanesulfonate monooxygenase SsuD/methylene tetrahydromethanopterin reductase-like flavin-dependent oxidoreductase (luciferase family)
MAIGCFISAGKSLEAAVTRVRLAEELGYERAFTTHINGAESLTLLTAYALATERIQVGTGVVPIYTRTPATMAQTAGTIAALSGDRLILGVGVSHRPVVEGWYGQAIDKPLAETREYIGKVRAILRGEQPEPGGKWPTGFALLPHLQRPELPVYNAGLSPKMLTLSGEVADGVILWLCNPDYIRDVVVPCVREGRERAGKPLEGFDIVAAVPGAVVDDPADAYATMRRDLLPYFGLPFYRAMIERSGFGDEIAAFDAAAGRGDGEAMQAAISDRFIAELCAIGDEDAVRSGLRRYAEAGTTTPSLGPVAGTDADAALRAGATALA